MCQRTYPRIVLPSRSSSWFCMLYYFITISNLSRRSLGLIPEGFFASFISKVELSVYIIHSKINNPSRRSLGLIPESFFASFFPKERRKKKKTKKRLRQKPEDALYAWYHLNLPIGRPTSLKTRRVCLI